MKKILGIFLLAVLLSSCQDRYRYPCQNPENIGKPECSVNNCAVTRECPNLEGEQEHGK